MMLWYTARGAGLATLLLLSASTCLGALVSRTRSDARRSEPGRRVLAQYLHRTFAALGLTVLLTHVTTIVADSYAHVGLTGALIPFASDYRPLWVTFGWFAVWLFVVLSVLGLARGRMARSPRAARTWRGVHALAYLGWASAMLHGFTSGTDSDAGWVRLLYLTCLLAVLGSVAVRTYRALKLRTSGAIAIPIGATR